MKLFTKTVKTTNPYNGEFDNIEVISKPKIILSFFSFVFLFSVFWGSWFITPEGHRTVVTQFSRAVYQTEPGLHFKKPFINSTVDIDVRERKSIEQLSAATKNQLPASVDVSINWSVHPNQVIELYRLYGSLSQFENRILNPKVRQAAKAAISKFNADELIRNRNAATNLILENSVDLISGYPVSVNAPQIEDIQLPEQYMEAVLNKERAREDAEREQYNLDRQKLEAAQLTQTAEAQREATKAQADGAAYKITTEANAQAQAIRIKGEAEADAIKVVQQAISGDLAIIQYEQAKRWNGELPTTMIPDASVPFIDLK